MPASRDPNFFPYANAAFCRPNWYPSAAIQKEAGALLDQQAQRRQKSQLRIDSLVDSAQKGDEIIQRKARQQLIHAEKGGCDCRPPVGQMRYVLQPNLGRNPPEAQRPGGLSEALQWAQDRWDDTTEKAEEIYNEGADYVMQTAGEVACSTLDALGLLEPLQKGIEENQDNWGSPNASGNDGGQYLKNLALGGQHFFFSKLIETCDLGPALRDFAAAERDRMQVAEAVCYIAALVGGIPSAGLSVATLGTLGTVFRSSKEIYAAGAEGQFPSAQSVWNLLNVTGELSALLDSQTITSIPEPLKDALESPTVEQAIAKAEQYLATTAKTATQLRELERAMLQVGEFVKPGRVGVSGTPVQPTPWRPQLTIIPPSPNPLVVRPDITPPPGDDPYPEEEFFENETNQKPETGGLVPLVGLGFLLDMVL